MKKYAPFIFAGIVLVAFALAWGPIKKHFYRPQPPVTPPVIVQIDPLCQYVENLQLRCLVSPASEGVMGPGRYVNFSPGAEPHARVGFSNGDLFDPLCIVPGVKAKDMIDALLAQLKSQEETNKVVFDEITFKLDRNFKAGLDLPIPKFPELQIKAGPQASEIQDISLKVPNAWLKVVDENRFIDLLAQAAIKQSCIDELIDQKYSVVSKAIIAQNYDINVTEKSGQSFALSTALSKGDLQMSGGGNANVNLDEVIKKASAIPVVVGVDFFNPSLLSKNRAKLIAPVFSATAQTRTTARASEQQGRPLWQDERIAQIGANVPLVRQGGGEGGSCGRPSSIQLASTVSPSPSPDSLDSRQFNISTNGNLIGGFTGHTIAGPFGVQNCIPTPEIVEAQVSFDSTVKITVKSETASTMQVSLKDIPSAVVHVSNWQNQDLEMAKTEAPAENAIQKFKLTGAGVYELRLTGTQVFRAAGGPINVNQSGTFTATIQ